MIYLLSFVNKIKETNNFSIYTDQYLFPFSFYEKVSNYPDVDRKICNFIERKEWRR